MGQCSIKRDAKLEIFFNSDHQQMNLINLLQMRSGRFRKYFFIACPVHLFNLNYKEWAFNERSENKTQLAHIFITPFIVPGNTNIFN